MISIQPILNQNFLFSVDCIWGAWSTWSTCSRCVNGTQERSRVIQQAAENGGVSCSGQASESRTCTNCNFYSHFMQPRRVSHFVFFLTGPYKLVKTGTTCIRITSKSECTEAAKSLGLTIGFYSGQAQEHSSSKRVPYCWFDDHMSSKNMTGGLYYNNDAASSYACGQGISQWWCICKA